MLNTNTNYDEIFGITYLCDECKGRGCKSCNGEGYKIVRKDEEEECDEG